MSKNSIQKFSFSLSPLGNSKSYLTVLGGFSLSFFLSSCAINPATGGANLVLMSENREKEIGLEEYEKVFKEYFLKSFSSRLAEYSNPEIEVNSKKKINDNYTIVSSTLVATDTRPKVRIDWRVYTKNPDNLLIRDLMIEGLSLARTQKEEFSSIINSNDGNVEALLKNLSDFVSQ